MDPLKTSLPDVPTTFNKYILTESVCRLLIPNHLNFMPCFILIGYASPPLPSYASPPLPGLSDSPAGGRWDISHIGQTEFRIIPVRMKSKGVVIENMRDPAKTLRRRNLR